MSIDYSEIAAGAHDAIVNAGMDMTLRVPAAATYSAATGTATASTTDYSASGVILPPGSLRGDGATFGPDVLVKAEAIIYLSAYGLSATPRPGALVIVGANSWRVIAADGLAPAGSAVLHVLAVVRA